MKTKTILSIAIISILPLTAHADITYVETNTPAFVGKEGTANIAPNNMPYAVAEITNDDATHIASTAYVKGAYNDTIAGINRVDAETKRLFNRTQGYLYYRDGGNEQRFNQEVKTDLANVINNGQLVNGMAVKNAIDGVNANITNTISSKRVEIYTTWDDDTAKQQVELANYVEPED